MLTRPIPASLRLAMLRVITAIIFAVLLVQLWRIQVLQGQGLRAQADENRFRLVEVQGPRRDTLVVRAHNRGKMIGRDAEFSRCKAIAEKAYQGEGGMLVLQGPAGIGKSCLADELVKHAESQSVRLVLVHNHSYNAQMPYASWRVLLQSIAVPFQET